MPNRLARRVLTTAAAAGLLVLGGCGEETPPEADPGTDPSTTTAQGWRDQDPCELLTAEETAAYLGGTPGEPARTDDQGRPRCEWEGPERSTVSVLLWQPPAPEIVTDDAKRTITVAGKTAHVTGETSIKCQLDIDATRAYVQLEVRTADTAEPGRKFCDTVAGTAEKIVERLGW
ncbi:DUF3558 family protein [Qaidamihabitans albus]|uniref:DUF3558 family protein n=1 Tax=Qaidamihabitans albus TaxID=2795733 RepID=UPI0018F20CA0|nr:DUF3558 family protein [Qaidamihabitans albus]